MTHEELIALDRQISGEDLRRSLEASMKHAQSEREDFAQQANLLLGEVETLRHRSHTDHLMPHELAQFVEPLVQLLQVLNQRGVSKSQCP